MCCVLTFTQHVLSGQKLAWSRNSRAEHFCKTTRRTRQIFAAPNLNHDSYIHEHMHTNDALTWILSRTNTARLIPVWRCNLTLNYTHTHVNLNHRTFARICGVLSQTHYHHHTDSTEQDGMDDVSRSQIHGTHTHTYTRTSRFYVYQTQIWYLCIYLKNTTQVGELPAIETLIERGAIVVPTLKGALFRKFSRMVATTRDAKTDGNVAM